MPASPCKVEGCSRPKLRPYHRCAWHHLAIQPADVQAAAARCRLDATPEALRPRSVPAKHWPSGMRYCGGCASFVPLDYVSGSRCKGCASASRHASAIKRTFGIDGDDYAELMRIQNGRCAICGAKPKSKRMAVDHAHDAAGAVRGLLCKRCNHDLLGAAHDSLAILTAAWHYLNAPPASGSWTPIAKQVALVPERENRPMSDDRGAGVGASTVAQTTDNATFQVPSGKVERGDDVASEVECDRTHYLPAGAVSDPAGDGYFRVYVRDGVELAPPF